LIRIKSWLDSQYARRNAGRKALKYPITKSIPSGIDAGNQHDRFH
jgi:hypothetical protein